jgi:hypothetical protein
MFESIDDLITDWARAHRLEWSRQYRDEEVRSIDLPLAEGRIAQIWLEPTADQTWRVRASDRRQQRFSLIVAKPQLQQGLSDALAVVKSWAPA